MKIIKIIPLLLPTLTYCQKTFDSENEFLSKINSSVIEKKDTIKANIDDRSFTNRSFIFYKKYISSQDIDACVFVPSCSEYAIQCIKKHGKIRGTIMTFDRLSRCNGSNNKQYEFDKNAKKFIDFP